MESAGSIWREEGIGAGTRASRQERAHHRHGFAVDDSSSLGLLQQPSWCFHWLIHTPNVKRYLKDWFNELWSSFRLWQRSYILVTGGIRRCTSAPGAASSFDDAVTERPDKNLATTLDGECLSHTAFIAFQSHDP